MPSGATGRSNAWKHSGGRQGPGLPQSLGVMMMSQSLEAAMVCLRARRCDLLSLGNPRPLPT